MQERDKILDTLSTLHILRMKWLFNGEKNLRVRAMSVKNAASEDVCFKLNVCKRMDESLSTVVGNVKWNIEIEGALLEGHHGPWIELEESVEAYSIIIWVTNEGNGTDVVGEAV